MSNPDYVPAEEHDRLHTEHIGHDGYQSRLFDFGTRFDCLECGTAWRIAPHQYDRWLGMEAAKEQTRMKTAEEHKAILIGHGDCGGAIVTGRAQTHYRHRCTGCKMSWKTSFAEFDRWSEMYQTRAFPETPTLEQLIRAERSKRDGLQKRYERFEAIVMRDLPFVGGLLDDYRSRLLDLEDRVKERDRLEAMAHNSVIDRLNMLDRQVGGLEAVVEVLATGNLEEDTVRADTLDDPDFHPVYSVQCPMPQIGKPPHCGDPTCRYRHDPPAENTDLGESGEAVPEPSLHPPEGWASYIYRQAKEAGIESLRTQYGYPTSWEPAPSITQAFDAVSKVWAEIGYRDAMNEKAMRLSAEKLLKTLAEYDLAPIHADAIDDWLRDYS